MDNCCDSLMKYIVFLFNFVFFLTGVILIGLGAYIRLTMKDYFDFIGDSYSSSSIVIIIIGGIIFLVAFFGCCGACSENACMMKTYGFLLMLILFAELGVAIAIFIFRNKADTVISQNMQKTMVNYRVKDKEGVTKAWDAVQKDAKCCGIESFRDWFGKEIKFNGVPPTCCKNLSNDQCAQGITNATATDVAGNTIYTVGCYQKLKDEIKNNVVVAGGIGIALVVIQVLGIIIACCLSNQMKDRHNYV